MRERWEEEEEGALFEDVEVGRWEGGAEWEGEGRPPTSRPTRAVASDGFGLLTPVSAVLLLIGNAVLVESGAPLMVSGCAVQKAWSCVQVEVGLGIRFITAGICAISRWRRHSSHGFLPGWQGKAKNEEEVSLLRGSLSPSLRAHLIGGLHVMISFAQNASVGFSLLRFFRRSVVKGHLGASDQVVRHTFSHSAVKALAYLAFVVLTSSFFPSSASTLLRGALVVCLPSSPTVFFDVIQFPASQEPLAVIAHGNSLKSCIGFLFSHATMFDFLTSRAPGRCAQYRFTSQQAWVLLTASRFPFTAAGPMPRRLVNIPLAHSAR